MHVAESCAQVWTCLRTRLERVWEHEVETPHLIRIWEHRVTLWARGLARNVWDHCELTGTYGLASERALESLYDGDLASPGPFKKLRSRVPQEFMTLSQIPTYL